MKSAALNPEIVNIAWQAASWPAGEGWAQAAGYGAACFEDSPPILPLGSTIDEIRA